MKTCKILTFTDDSNVLSKSLSYSSFIFPRSISERLTTIRISDRSSVPAPSIALRNFLAKNAGGLCTHST